MTLYLENGPGYIATSSMSTNLYTIFGLGGSSTYAHGINISVVRYDASNNITDRCFYFTFSSEFTDKRTVDVLNTQAPGKYTSYIGYEVLKK